ncbi:unnamed protein product [Mytilus coruscus]|uniref:Uncharacterized protein n=1 Tax=Mytilus coruscus TaxID=42192 RepID=A0A6J8EWP3_MYTCO|nr:unnamed protein product [Mytilus coruscus]
MHRRSLKLRKRMSDTNTDSDSEMAKAFKDIPSAQPPSITVIPINFDMDSWDNENDNEGETLIDNCVEKIDNLLSKRHHISTLVRDLRRFQNDELPVYAVLKDASFSPIFGSDEAKTFFSGKIKQFNTEMRRSYREFITTESKIYVDSDTEEINKIWQETTKEIRSRNKDSSRTIVKLNERIRQLKEEWAEKYRRASFEPVRGSKEKMKDVKKEAEEERTRPRKQQEQTQSDREVQRLKRELDDLKNMVEGNISRRRGRGGRGYNRGGYYYSSRY